MASSIKEEIDGNPIQKQLISAILMGTNLDANLTMGNLVAIVGDEAKAYKAKAGR